MRRRLLSIAAVLLLTLGTALPAVAAPGPPGPGTAVTCTVSDGIATIRADGHTIQVDLTTGEVLGTEAIIGTEIILTPSQLARLRQLCRA